MDSVCVLKSLTLLVTNSWIDRVNNSHLYLDELWSLSCWLVVNMWLLILYNNQPNTTAIAVSHSLGLKVKTIPLKWTKVTQTD